MKSYRLTDRVVETGQRISFRHQGGTATMVNHSNGVTVSTTVQEFLDAGWIEEAPPTVNLRMMQNEVRNWADRNFDMVNLSPEDQTALVALTGVGEEAGEIVRAIRKLCQGIRGTREEWIEEIKKEAGDLVIQLMSGLNALDLDINDCVHTRWQSVGKRDWKKFPKNGLTE
jgi:NTP pyrophosphatase (non-canonical NTP hydrolase)